MAKKTLIIDDLTGDTGARTRALSFDGVDYEIDLTDASFADLRRLIKPYLRAARPVRGEGAPRGAGRPRAARSTSTPRSTSRTGGAASAEPAIIRAWARATGVAVPERGRIPATVRAAWREAGSPA